MLKFALFCVLSYYFQWKKAHQDNNLRFFIHRPVEMNKKAIPSSCHMKLENNLFCPSKQVKSLI